ncbi:MAG: hypothetical protein RBR67_17385 [Desulfobacterium sp.]|jgi:hypothetical protein|nr:hypothetical protein [Desulfobacterium sp.]
MNTEKYNIETLPFFDSFVPNSATKVVIDVKAFDLWIKSIQHMDFLSDAEDRERTSAYSELENGGSLDLKDAMKEW